MQCSSRPLALSLQQYQPSSTLTCMSVCLTTGVCKWQLCTQVFLFFDLSVLSLSLSCLTHTYTHHTHTLSLSLSLTLTLTLTLTGMLDHQFESLGSLKQAMGVYLNVSPEVYLYLFYLPLFFRHTHTHTHTTSSYLPTLSLSLSFACQVMNRHYNWNSNTTTSLQLQTIITDMVAGSDNPQVHQELICINNQIADFIN